MEVINKIRSQIKLVRESNFKGHVMTIPIVLNMPNLRTISSLDYPTYDRMHLYRDGASTLDLGNHLNIKAFNSDEELLGWLKSYLVRRDIDELLS